MAKDIYLRVNSGGANDYSIVNNKILFPTTAGIVHEPWRSAGSALETVFAKDILSHPAYSLLSAQLDYLCKMNCNSPQSE
jgi:hypothetical protein